MLRNGYAQLRRGSKRAMLIEGEAERKRCSVKDELKKGGFSLKKRANKGQCSVKERLR